MLWMCEYKTNFIQVVYSCLLKALTETPQYATVYMDIKITNK